MADHNEGKRLSASAANEDDMDPTQYYKNRSKDLASLKKTGVDPYPHKFDTDMTIEEYVAKCGDGKNCRDDMRIKLAGRITNKRVSSPNLVFYDVYGSGLKIQATADARVSDIEYKFTELHSSVQLGDIVGICGYPGSDVSCKEVETKIVVEEEMSIKLWIFKDIFTCRDLTTGYIRIPGKEGVLDLSILLLLDGDEIPCQYLIADKLGESHCVPIISAGTLNKMPVILLKRIDMNFQIWYSYHYEKLVNGHRNWEEFFDTDFRKLMRGICTLISTLLKKNHRHGNLINGIAIEEDTVRFFHMSKKGSRDDIKDILIIITNVLLKSDPKNIGNWVVESHNSFSRKWKILVVLLNNYELTKNAIVIANNPIFWDTMRCKQFMEDVHDEIWSRSPRFMSKFLDKYWNTRWIHNVPTDGPFRKILEYEPKHIKAHSSETLDPGPSKHVEELVIETLDSSSEHLGEPAAVSLDSKPREDINQSSQRYEDNADAIHYWRACRHHYHDHKKDDTVLRVIEKLDTFGDFSTSTFVSIYNFMYKSRHDSGPIRDCISRLFQLLKWPSCERDIIGVALEQLEPKTEK